MRKIDDAAAPREVATTELILFLRTVDDAARGTGMVAGMQGPPRFAVAVIVGAMVRAEYGARLSDESIRDSLANLIEDWPRDRARKGRVSKWKRAARIWSDATGRAWSSERVRQAWMQRNRRMRGRESTPDDM